MFIEFLKRRYYKGRLQEIGDNVEVSPRDGRAYINAGAAKLISPPKKVKRNYIRAKQAEAEVKLALTEDINNLSYKELVALAKSKSLPAKGKKEEIKQMLKENGDV